MRPQSRIQARGQVEVDVEVEPLPIIAAAARVRRVVPDCWQARHLDFAFLTIESITNNSKVEATPCRPLPRTRSLDTLWRVSICAPPVMLIETLTHLSTLPPSSIHPSTHTVRAGGRRISQSHPRRPSVSSASPPDGAPSAAAKDNVPPATGDGYPRPETGHTEGNGNDNGKEDHKDKDKEQEQARRKKKQGIKSDEA